MNLDVLKAELQTKQLGTVYEGHVQQARAV